MVVHWFVHVGVVFQASTNSNVCWEEAFPTNGALVERNAWKVVRQQKDQQLNLGLASLCFFHACGTQSSVLFKLMDEVTVHKTGFKYLGLEVAFVECSFDLS